MAKRLLIQLILLTLLCFLSLPARTPDDKSLEDKKISELLAKMTMEEKIGQLAQFNSDSRPTMEELKAVIRQGGVGSFLNPGDRAAKDSLQRVAVEESRLGIPLIFGRDVIHGFRTIFPIPLGQAASWNPLLVEKASSIAAREAAQTGVHWTFAPMMDIARDPRWGRIAESLGEDPVLAGELAAAMTRGFQGKNLADPNSIAACAKHYVGYGAAEGGRDYNTTLIPEQELRNVYLVPFHSAVKAGVATLMSAFNDLNGIPASGNAFTLRQVLRNEWNFDGFVVSDWTSMTEMINHGYCADDREVALKALSAGVDMEMVSETYRSHVRELIESGQLDQNYLDEAVANILRIKIRLGLFENPYSVPEDKSVMLHPDHLQTARDLAAQSLVLLKNKNVLPVGPGVKTIAIIGPMADNPLDQIGTWAPDRNPDDSVTPLQVFREQAGLRKILFAKGLDKPRSMDKKHFAAAIDAAKKADLAIVFVGEDELLSGEAHSRAFLNLPGLQEELISAVAATKTPMVLVIMAGRPLTFLNPLDQAEAVLYAWHPGTMAGPALYDVLTGAVAPSGKLPVTLPRTVGQVPIYYNHRNTGRPPSAEMLGIPLGTPEDPKGFVSSYLDADFTPQFPFGFGLSYTTFTYSNLKLSTTKLRSGQRLTVTFTLENSGSVAAEEVVQLYTRDITGSITRPVKELKAFRRVMLKPGQKQELEFVLTETDLAFWNAEMKFTAEPGKFVVMVGGSSADSDLLKSEFELSAEN